MRSFVAIEISDSDIINSIKKFQAEINIKAKPVNPNNFHFTLQFLGEISDELAQKVVLALKTIKFSSFIVGLQGVGAFPRSKSPRVVWIGTDEDGGNMLVQLSKMIERLLEPLGLLPDKSFKPHMTVFRIKKKIGDITKELESKKAVDFGKQMVTCIKIKKSELTPNGPIYSDMGEVTASK
ncbi:RNA 2',3'-cyclic phosphodiesterase [Nitrosopumilus sp.]|uniref:RNA 2',3'-cyclic phosphodiesterase n=1 Tax=Nitrosopumilus sp. TaxID=2024843 RepID=UPI00292E283D|nr:RNA 2',3'-cyclic phosphodiesterase [Nitrosopumilus sp.]